MRRAPAEATGKRGFAGMTLGHTRQPRKHRRRSSGSGAKVSSEPARKVPCLPLSPRPSPRGMSPQQMSPQGPSPAALADPVIRKCRRKKCRLECRLADVAARNVASPINASHGQSSGDIQPKTSLYIRCNTMLNI